MSGWGWESHPEKYPCPRCGSAEEFCLPLSDSHKHYSVLSLHKERGMAPADLTRFGYVQYTAVVDGEEMKLWRKPGTRRCTRGQSTTSESTDQVQQPVH